MNLFNRAAKSLIKQPLKTVILFFLIFLLTSVVSAAISISSAVYNTEANLRSNFPPVAVVEQSHQSHLDFWAAGDIELEQMEFQPWPTNEDFQNIANLPYVEIFDYILHAQLLSTELERSWLMAGVDHPFYIDDVSDRDNLEEIEPGLRGFNIRGVFRSDFFDLEMGRISLIEGRNFEASDLEQALPVALISREFANINRLAVGDIMNFENRVTDWRENDFEEETRPLYFQEFHQVEVIGIYEVLIEETTGSGWDALRNAEFPNTIYVNGLFATQIETERQFAWFSMFEFDEELANIIVTPYFLLYDAMDMQAFSNAANQYLSSWFAISDMSEMFPSFVISASSMTDIFNSVLIGAIVATILIIAFSVTLFLMDRRHEIGIYLALGERKVKIILQILSEVMLVSIVAMMIALFVGRIFSINLSNQMLENHLLAAEGSRIQMVNGWPMEFPSRLFNTELSFLYSGPMSVDEMLEAFDTTLDSGVIILFFGVGLFTIAFATIIPIIYIVKFEPKKVLL